MMPMIIKLLNMEDYLVFYP